MVRPRPLRFFAPALVPLMCIGVCVLTWLSQLQGNSQRGDDALPSDSLDGDIGTLPKFSRVTTKTLHPRALSHEEHRRDFLTIEYTPYAVERPVDATFPMQAARQGRRVDLLIGVHVGAEDTGDRLLATLRSISDNLTALPPHLALSWNAVAVCILVDSLAMNVSMVEVLASRLALFDASLMQQHVNGRPVTMHVFEARIRGGNGMCSGLGCAGVCSGFTC